MLYVQYKLFCYCHASNLTVAKNRSTNKTKHNSSNERWQPKQSYRYIYRYE